MVFFEALYITLKEASNLIWFFTHSTLNLPLSHFLLSLYCSIFVSVGEKCSYLSEEERVGGS